MSRICVFSGSRFGRRPQYRRAAEELGAALVERGLGLVFGGGSVGLMGVIADAVLRAGGEAIGVIPRALADRELAHMGLSELHVVASMHERKALMADLSSAFVALPGGIGTLEETFEVWTWSYLGIHAKPLGLLDVDGFYGGLLAFVDSLVEEQFVPPASRALLLADADPARLVDRLVAAQVPSGLREIEPQER